MEQINFNELANEFDRTQQPLFINRTNKEELVLLDAKTFNDMWEESTCNKIDEALNQVKNGEVLDGWKSLKELRLKYDL